MIETISSEQGRLKDAATAGAAFNYRPPVQSVSPVTPTPALVKGIGQSTSADAFRGSSPDLQSLLDSLLANFGTEHDLVDADARDLETNARIRENNDGSREAVKSLQSTASRGEDTVELDRELEDQRTKFQQKRSTEKIDSEPLQRSVESRLDEVEGDLEQAESLSGRASEASGDTSESSGNQKRSAELFEQKAAAAQSAALLHQIMVQKVLRKVETQLEKERRQKQPNLAQLQNDPEFAERLREMHRLLREKG